jgi:hypothetical protein
MKLKGIKVPGLGEKDGKLVPIKRRYDVSTDLQRRASAKIPKLATRAKALSVKKVDHV